VQAGIGPASHAELLARPGAPAAGPRAIVDIRTLLYRGEQALMRAQELRSAAQHASGDTLRALVDEVCDLVALALEPAPTGAP
jgi:hypothetical protein